MQRAVPKFHDKVALHFVFVCPVTSAVTSDSLSPPCFAHLAMSLPSLPPILPSGPSKSDSYPDATTGSPRNT